MSGSLLKSVSLVSLMTFISRILGFARDLIAAQIFGVNASVDAFYIAFKIPNFMRNIFAEGSFSQAFVPVLSDYRQKRPKEEVLIFISHLSFFLSFILLIVTFLGIWRAANLVSMFSPGLDSYRFNLATEMLRITFPYIMLISLTAFAGSVLNCYGKFGIPAFTPALLNISLILTALILDNYFSVPVESQAWGVLIAGFIQLFFQLTALYRMGFLIKPTFSLGDKGVKRVLKLIIPAIFGASIGQISILVNTILASFLVTGSISWLYYSERLAYFPLGIFGVALTTVILPHLSRQYAKNSNDDFSEALEWGIKWNLIIGIPASIVMLILSGPLIVSLFQYGKFTLNDVLMTQKCVITYGIGLQAFMLAKILSSAFYARHDIRTPVIVSVITLGINIFFSLILVGPLAHAGLALSTSISSWANIIFLCVILFRKNLIFKNFRNWGKFLLQLLFSNVLLSAFLFFTSENITVWMDWSWEQRLFHILLLGLASCIIYIFSLWITNSFPKKILISQTT